MNPKLLAVSALSVLLACGASYARDREEGEGGHGDRDAPRERAVRGQAEHPERHEMRDGDREGPREHAEAREQREQHPDRDNPTFRERLEARGHEGDAPPNREMREQMARREQAERAERDQRERREGPENRGGPLPEERIVHFVREHLPHMLDELNELRERRPDEYRRELMEISEHIRHYEEIRQYAPDVAEALLESQKIEHACQALAREIRETDNPGMREQKVRKLHEMLNHVFELRLKEPELEIRRMEREIGEIKQMIGRRRESQGRIVEKHLHDMIDARPGELEWW